MSRLSWQRGRESRRETALQRSGSGKGMGRWGNWTKVTTAAAQSNGKWVRCSRRRAGARLGGPEAIRLDPKHSSTVRLAL